MNEMIRIFGIQTLNSILSSLAPYIQPRTLAYWTMLLTIKKGLPASVNLIQTTRHRYSQKLFFPLILDSVMLTININHYNGLISINHYNGVDFFEVALLGW